MSGIEGAASGTDAFGAARPRLVGLAYRMLGTFADAEDVVQEAWLRWSSADRAAIEKPEAWLTTVTTRLALDRLKSAARRREHYVGPWLPEPVVAERGPEESAELSDTLTLGFLTLLDELGPVERAVFLLADVFATPYSEVATTVGKSEVACRQIASRARRRLHGAATTRKPTADERLVVDELLMSIAMGDVAKVLERMAPNVVCISDGGPNKRAARRPVVGADRVARLLINLTKKYVEVAGRFVPAVVNGDPGLIGYVGDQLDFVAAFEVDDSGVVAGAWIVRAPEKLQHVLEPLDIV